MTVGMVSTAVTKVDQQGVHEHQDELAQEAPLEIRINGRGYAVTMRTPGHDVDLAVGFAVSEGLISCSGEVLSAGRPDGAEGDIVDIALSGPGALVAMDRHRHVYTTSSCGVCGLASIDAVVTTSRFDVADDPVACAPAVLGALPDRLREQQALFGATGGVHAAGLFDAAGRSVVVREDVGRHNAVDKVVGWALSTELVPARHHILQVSGRASFELVQKAAMAGIPVLAAVSAPSSLAVELAQALGITLVGFSRGSAFNVYSRADRLA